MSDTTGVPRSVHDLVERQAALRADAVYAVSTETAETAETADPADPVDPAAAPEALCYGELRARCGRVAALLQAQGLLPGDSGCERDFQRYSSQSRMPGWILG